MKKNYLKFGSITNQSILYYWLWGLRIINQSISSLLTVKDKKTKTK